MLHPELSGGNETARFHVASRTPNDSKHDNAVGLARKGPALDRRSGNPDPVGSRLVDDAHDAAT